MKKQILLAVSVLAVASCAFAREMDSLPSMREFRDHVKEAPAVAVPAAEAVAPTSSECMNPDLNGAVIGRGVFQSDFRISKDGVQVGLLSNEGNGYKLETVGGQLIAASIKSDVKGGRKLIVVDCAGSKLGTIVETDGSSWQEGSTYKVYDASDAEVAASGSDVTDQLVLSSGGETLGVSSSQSGFGDKYKVSVSSKLDSRVMAMATAMQNSAAYRRSQERRRENPHEPHGGHDRY